MTTAPSSTTPHAAARDQRLHLVCGALGPAALVAGWFAWHDMAAATWCMVGGAALALALGQLALRRVQRLPLGLAVAGLAVGGLSAALHDGDVVKLQTTFVEGAIGLALAGALLFGKNPLAGALGTRIRLSDAAWRALAWRVALLCLAVAVANEIVRRTLPDAAWVLFHFPGLPLVHALFLGLQWPWLRRQGASAPDADPHATSLLPAHAFDKE